MARALLRPKTGGWPALSSLFSPVLRLWVPRPCDFCKGGYDAADTMGFVMPSGLHRTYGADHLHFITCSCYRRLQVAPSFPRSLPEGGIAPVADFRNSLIQPSTPLYTSAGNIRPRDAAPARAFRSNTAPCASGCSMLPLRKRMGILTSPSFPANCCA